MKKYINFESREQLNELLLKLEKNGYYWNGADYDLPILKQSNSCPNSGSLVVESGCGLMFTTKKYGSKVAENIKELPCYYGSKGYCK